MAHEAAMDYPALSDAADVERYVRDVADTIYDPCGMASGINIGMNEMGLIRQVGATSNGGQWDVHILVRLTSPGCEYFFAFKDNLEQRLEPHPEIGQLTVEWDPTLDWTPESLTPEARERLEQRRRELWSGKRPRRTAREPGVVRLHVS